jgi:hypothetical protein
VHLHIILQKQCTTIKLDTVTETYSRSTLETSLTVVVLAVRFAVAVAIVVDLVVVDMAVATDIVGAAAGIVASDAGIEGVVGTVVVVGNVADYNAVAVGTVVGTVADYNAVAVGNCVDMVAAVADNTAEVVVDVDIACTTVVGDRKDPTVQVLLVTQNDGCVGVSVLNYCNTHCYA